VIASYLNQKNGLEGTTYIAYDFNTNNNTTDYHSGQVFHIDATATNHRDSCSGARLGSFKEFQAGVGPVVSYAAPFGKLGVAASVKWLPQIGTDNTLKGNFVWAKVGATF